MVILTPWWQIHYITGTYWLQIPKQWGITVWGASQSHQLLFDLNLIGNCCCLRGSSVKERGMLVKTVLHNLFLLNTNEWVSNFQSFILPLKVLTSLRLLKRHLETNLYSYQSLIKKKKNRQACSSKLWTTNFISFFFLTHHVSLETLYAWLPGPNPVPIPVLAPNGLLRLNPEVWPKLKVLVPPNGGGLAPNPPVLVPVI